MDGVERARKAGAGNARAGAVPSAAASPTAKALQALKLAAGPAPWQVPCDPCLPQLEDCSPCLVDSRGLLPRLDVGTPQHATKQPPSPRRSSAAGV